MVNPKNLASIVADLMQQNMFDWKTHSIESLSDMARQRLKEIFGAYSDSFSFKIKGMNSFTISLAIDQGRLTGFEVEANLDSLEDSFQIIRIVDGVVTLEYSGFQMTSGQIQAEGLTKNGTYFSKGRMFFEHKYDFDVNAERISRAHFYEKTGKGDHAITASQLLPFSPEEQYLLRRAFKIHVTEKYYPAGLNMAMFWSDLTMYNGETLRCVYSLKTNSSEGLSRRQLDRPNAILDAFRLAQDSSAYISDVRKI